MSFEMEKDWEKQIEEQLTERLISLITESFGEEIAHRLLANIRISVVMDDFETVFQNEFVDLLAWGDYFFSWIKDKGLLKDDHGFEISVGTDEPKAEGLEWGTTPQEEVNTTDAELIAWAKKKGISNPTSFGRIVAKKIREDGQPPRPALRRGIGKTKTQQEIIKADTIKRIRSKKGSLSM